MDALPQNSAHTSILSLKAKYPFPMKLLLLAKPLGLWHTKSCPLLNRKLSFLTIAKFLIPSLQLLRQQHQSFPALQDKRFSSQSERLNLHKGFKMSS